MWFFGMSHIGIFTQIFWDVFRVFEGFLSSQERFGSNFGVFLKAWGDFWAHFRVHFDAFLKTFFGCFEIFSEMF